MGYLRNDALNTESWTSDGWFLTGDLGVRDHGRLRLVGRLKDVIKHGGALVWPRELEEVIGLHPSIESVSVIGIPDDYFGENACACVVLEPGEQITLADLVHFLQDRIATYKLPQQMVVVPEIPYTSSGKAQKQVLRERVLNQSRA